MSRLEIVVSVLFDGCEQTVTCYVTMVSTRLDNTLGSGYSFPVPKLSRVGDPRWMIILSMNPAFSSHLQYHAQLR